MGRKKKEKWHIFLCPACGKEVEARISGKRKYCSQMCCKKSQSKENHPKGMLGKRHSAEAIAKMKKIQKEIHQRPETIAKMSKSQTGRRHSAETREKMRKAQSSLDVIERRRAKICGEKHWNWKGGISSFRNKIYWLPEYSAWRGECFKRDSYICQDCGTKSSNLYIHHIKGFSEIIKEHNIKTIKEARGCKELWDMNNGVTLCFECHGKCHLDIGLFNIKNECIVLNSNLKKGEAICAI